MGKMKSVKICVIGGLGSAGRRYCAILKYLGIKYEIIDFDIPSSVYGMTASQTFSNGDWDRAIIATPTDTHYSYSKALIKMGKSFLCEKPLSVSLEECEELVKMDQEKLGSIVNNYFFAFGNSRQKPDLFYDYYHTGKDGLLWDCCQLLYLDPQCVLRNRSPIWTVRNGRTTLSYETLERSYITMIQCWLANDHHLLWSLEDGLRMTRAVLNRLDCGDLGVGSMNAHIGIEGDNP